LSKQCPNGSSALRQLAVALLQSGRPEEAIKKGEEALRLSPRDPNLTAALALRGNLDEARLSLAESLL
jgi:Flp pilus assembly protein TadD